MTMALLESLVRKIQAGKMSDIGFKADMWGEVCRDVLQYDPSQQHLLDRRKCQGKLDSLKKMFDDW